MPLIHSKRPAAFKKNIETEMEHGKPQKQAVAIAYRMAGEHKAKGGEMCAHGGPVHCNMGCYAKGGEVGWKDDSMLMGRKPSAYKETPQKTEPGFGMDPLLMGRKGGEYEEPAEDTGPRLSEDPELLASGGEVEDYENEGEEGEEELEHILAEELLHAMEKKDKKGVAEAIEALVMQCLNKGEM